MNSQRRLCLMAAGALPLAGLLEGCAVLSVLTRPDAIVDRDGSAAGSFRTIQAAMDAAPAQSTKPWLIAIRPGRYYEKLVITKLNIHLLGANRDNTILTFDAYSGLKKPDGSTWGTSGCGTLIVQAEGFTAENMTIDNGYDYPANDAKDPRDPSFERSPQAVAVMIDKGADRSFFNKVKITGHQDTLFVNTGRSCFRDSLVSGHIDFIFGAGQALFERCDIVTRTRVRPNVNPVGYVTAPSTQISNKYGLIFVRCKLLKENDQLPAESSPLGRPWHPTANFLDGRYADPDAIGNAVFIECFMDDHITTDGWASMQGTSKVAGERLTFTPESARFFEYKNTGPGARTGSKRRQLSDAEAAEYTPHKVLAGWKP